MFKLFIFLIFLPDLITSRNDLRVTDKIWTYLTDSCADEISNLNQHRKVEIVKQIQQIENTLEYYFAEQSPVAFCHNLGSLINMLRILDQLSEPCHIENTTQIPEFLQEVLSGPIDYLCANDSANFQKFLETSPSKCLRRVLVDNEFEKRIDSCIQNDIEQIFTETLTKEFACGVLASTIECASNIVDSECTDETEAKEIFLEFLETFTANCEEENEENSSNMKYPTGIIASIIISTILLV